MKNLPENIMKRLGLLLTALTVIIVMLTGFGSVVSASTSEASQKQYVIDDADILTDKEEEKLQKACEKASDGCKTDVCIITARTGLDYSDLVDYARDIINEKYGYNGNSSTPDAIVYIVDMKSRADWLVTSGIAKTDISQSNLEKMIDKSEPLLTKGEYYKAFDKYIDNVQKYLNKSFSYKVMKYFPIKLLISLVVAVIVVLIMMHNAKSKMTVNENTYTKDHKVEVRQRYDRFVNTTVVTRTIESSSSSGSSGGSGGGGNSGSAGGHF